MSEDQYASLDQLFEPSAATLSGMPEDDVKVEGLGLVRVRGLSRDEAIRTQTDAGTLATEQLMLSYGMVRPTMTVAQAARWQKSSLANVIEPVSRRIGELSGMLDSSAKEIVKEFISSPELEFRDVPSPETGDDGSAPANGNVS